MHAHLQLDRLRCPISGGNLQWLPRALLEALREAVMATLAVNRAGELLTDIPEAALVCQASGWIYPVKRGIPVLLPGEAIDRCANW